MKIAVFLIGKPPSGEDLTDFKKYLQQFLPSKMKYTFFCTPEFPMNLSRSDIPYYASTEKMSQKASECLRIYEYENDMLFDVCIKMPFEKLAYDNHWFIPPARNDEVYTIRLPNVRTIPIGIRNLYAASFDFFYSESTTFKLAMEMNSFNICEFMANITPRYMSKVSDPTMIHFYMHMKRIGLHNVPLSGVRHA